VAALAAFYTGSVVHLARFRRPRGRPVLANRAPATRWRALNLIVKLAAGRSRPGPGALCRLPLTCPLRLGRTLRSGAGRSQRSFANRLQWPA